MKKILILNGGFGDEREISLRSGHTMKQELLKDEDFKQKYRVENLDVKQDIYERLKEIQPEIIINCLHGQFGEDGKLQGILEHLSIPYLGESVTQSAITFDKLQTKYVLFGNYIKTPPFITLYQDNFSSIINKLKINNIDFPFMLKPIKGGSSLGIFKIKEAKELKQALEKPIKIEEYFLEKYIEGQEITVGATYIKGQWTILPFLGIKPKGDFYDYSSKYNSGMTDFIIPYPTSKELEYIIKNIVGKNITKLFRFKNCIRIDLIIDNDDAPHVLEINTSPGMTETSDIPQMLNHLNISIAEWIDGLIEKNISRDK